MDINMLKAFFLWCTIINGIMRLFIHLMRFFAVDWIYSVHNKLFNVSRENFNTMLYTFIMLYKIFWLVFNLVPWLALLIIA